jgi:stage II sporulation protein P
MAAVGRALAQPLEEAGIGLIHDTTQHDYPSYNGSYERSAETVGERLEETPSLRILLDLHRDAMPRDDDVIVKPVKLIEGKKAAQIMIIAGCDDGEMNMPNWPRNLRFAVALQNKIEEKYPGLMRPIYLCYRKYNMHLSDGSLLLEFGSNANTLEEAEYSARLAGEALAELILEQQEQGEEEKE